MILLLSLTQKARLSVCFVILKIPLFGLLWFFILENAKLNCKSNKSDIASEKYCIVWYWKIFTNTHHYDK